MGIKYLDEYRDVEISESIVQKIAAISKKNIRLMEVCGTHTMSIFRSGIRTLLPDTITLISGPGCPVCVTAQRDIDAFIELSRVDGVVLATFGDLMRVPGTKSSLQKESAAGSDVRIVYSPMDALEIAKKNPEKKVVFLGVGFETTAPTIAASILSAKEMGIDNFYVYSAHKLVPPALTVLMETKGVKIDGFILPGHVSVIIGINAYAQFFDQYKVPSVVTGFEPVDLLQAISMLVEQVETGKPCLGNGYQRAVTSEGNVKAQSVMRDVFEPMDANWRGIGVIPGSGLKIRKAFEPFDAQKMFNVETTDTKEPKGCACGEILTGLKIPPECSLYKKACTPTDPVGPCMVSSEGTCAAYYRYHDSD
ncbi:MAG: hydrogenase formation protein HypD [Deltaproteobacteria bacterium]|nr:hydrogenase formation protein HypD [Deltaproteobacteria bacterium]MBW1847387.1 hydrogenase formation protein HypD [Deltaproteobacteria bacterium]MBW2181125.1 hydrogenase formation protein HypD [Deltaproteobacteria bacterium]MBW2364335.1 hydrogenase formation protein HypD [Deltaproteobacteria bacterium]